MVRTPSNSTGLWTERLPYATEKNDGTSAIVEAPITVKNVRSPFMWTDIGHAIRSRRGSGRSQQRMQVVGRILQADPSELVQHLIRIELG